MKKRAQVSVEYLIIVGFVTFVVIAIIGVAFYYSGTIKDKIKDTQVNNYANKLISTAESVFYSGNPSKATITCYLPDNVNDISIASNMLIMEFHSSSGQNKIGFSSKVPIEESSVSPLSVSQGLKKIEIIAEIDKVTIGQA